MDQNSSPKKAKYSTNEEIMSATALVSYFHCYFLECSGTPGCRFISILDFHDNFTLLDFAFLLLLHLRFGGFLSFIGKCVRLGEIPGFVVSRKFQRIHPVKYFVKLKNGSKKVL